MAAALIGLGSNLGDRVGNLLSALRELRHHSAIAVQRASTLVQSHPVGGPPGQSDFFNAAAVIETRLEPAELLAELKKIENKLGRQASERWGPRSIDLDLLLYGEIELETPELAIPHPRLHERRFVLAPAAEIAADWPHPVSHRTIGEMLAALPPGSRGDVGMRVIVSPADVQSSVINVRRQGGRVGLVPTMGALHEGHLSLVRIARQRSDYVVVTIFVNPAQFGPQEDFREYPRTLDGDLRALSAEGCDLVFVPSADEMYPPGFSTYLEPPTVAQPFEGVCRPGHFRGVATIVLKLFHLIPAKLACFGQKDYQQLLVIRKMVEDLALPIEIVPCPIVREPDGLAMSSRNHYLSPAERQQALALPRALSRAEQFVAGGQRDCTAVLQEMHRLLSDSGIGRIDYVALADPETLTEKAMIDGPTVALLAAYVGSTRLIDNRLLNL